jgi:hypothetical protein
MPRIPATGGRLRQEDIGQPGQLKTKIKKAEGGLGKI